MKEGGGMKVLIPGLLLLQLAAVHGVAVTVNGSSGHDVLLPCDCTGRDLKKGLRWQNGTEKGTVVFIYNSSGPFNFTDRITTFVEQDPYNCSILLRNIEMNDAGPYTCRFHTPGYQQHSVNLIVSASPSFIVKINACKRKVSENVLECDVKGLDKKAMIQWMLNGSPLTDSPTVKITESHKQDEDTVHTFSSQLSSTVNMTSEPTCHVKAGDASVVITEPCLTRVPGNIWMYSIIIPVIVILGIITFLACRLRLSRRGQKVNTEES